jgi:hypothetical protein
MSICDNDFLVLLWYAFGMEKFEKCTPHPNTLDVVMIDGRWAQTATDTLINYLDDGSSSHINWEDYTLIKKFDDSIVKYVKNQENFTEKEISRIHWGPEEKEHPYLKEQVKVFGKYQKK